MHDNTILSHNIFHLFNKDTSVETVKRVKVASRYLENMDQKYLEMNKKKILRWWWQIHYLYYDEYSGSVNRHLSKSRFCLQNVNKRLINPAGLNHLGGGVLIVKFYFFLCIISVKMLTSSHCAEFTFVQDQKLAKSACRCVQSSKGFKNRRVVLG